MTAHPWPLAALLGLIACKDGDPPRYERDHCDAGDEAWVQRVFPLVLGRKVHGADETRLWADVAERVGRPVVIRALAESPEYVDRWQDWINDALLVARTGDRDQRQCYGTPMIPDDDGALAEWLAIAPSESGPYTYAFDMADVVRSGLKADDISAAWRLNLFARMARPAQGANVGPRAMEENRRKNFGDSFEHAYLNRDLVCLQCHNSEFSVTDSAEAAEDRHWPIAGLFERAVFGNSFGIDEATAYQPFRYAGLVATEADRVTPWGMDSACGAFAPPGAVGDDFLGHEGYFLQAFGEDGSVWDVEDSLRIGVDSLERNGLVVAEDGTVAGPDAFAYLVGESISNQVWQEATGEKLTIANYFPRNEGQRDRLAGLTDRFVETRFSLVELLIAVTSDPIFNAGAPESCLADPYGFEPIVDPWTVTVDDELARGNGPGDFVHRHSARVLIRSVHDSMGWPQPAGFLAETDPVNQTEVALGAFARESQPGFRGTDFQGTLSFEATYGACTQPDAGGASNGCEATPTFAGCASCDCQSYVCGQDPYCCEVQWDQTCVDSCNNEGGGCGGGLSEVSTDTVDRLIERARETDGTVGDVVLGLKDRLVAHAEVDAHEQAIIEDLLDASFDTPIADAPEIELRLRNVCGALLISPDFFLALDPGPAGPSPTLALDVDADCAWARGLLAAQGIDVICGGAE